MKSVYVFILLLIPLVSNSKTSSFYDFSPAPSIIKNVHYPRNDRPLYRGTTEEQMSLNKALSALFGDSNALIESKLFLEISSRLQGKKSEFQTALDAQIENQIKFAIKSNNNNYLSETHAIQKSKEICDQLFEYHAKNFPYISRYFNYRSSGYIDWPNNLIFSTIIPPAAATYGDRIIVTIDKGLRSLDVNYWNLVNNNVHFDHTRDVGEFITFGYTPADNIIGYEVRKGSSKSWHQVDFAIYKSFTNKQYVLVFSGMMQSTYLSNCLFTDLKKQIISHCKFKPGRIQIEEPDLYNEKVQLIGLITTCNSSDGKCEEPESSELSKYQIGKMPSRIEKWIQMELTKIHVKEKKIELVSFR